MNKSEKFLMFGLLFGIYSNVITNDSLIATISIILFALLSTICFVLTVLFYYSPNNSVRVDE